MATSTRVTRSKGESDRLSLPMRSRPTRRDATLGRNGGTALSTSGWEHQQQMPTKTLHLTQSPEAAPGKRTATPPMLPSDYTTQGDPDASPSSSFKPQDVNDEFLGTNNFFVPDGSNRQIHQIHNKVFHAGYLENGNNAYLLELPALENMLNTRKFLMDEMSG